MQAARGTPIATAGQGGLERPARWWWLFAAVAAGGVLLDVLTKVAVVRFLDPAEPVRLLGGLLTLRLIRNPGAAFSLGEGFTPVFGLLSAAVLLFVVIRLAPRIGHIGWAVALGLLCAGVGGNLVDRLFRQPGILHGHVVDFLQLPYWPIFNVADMCITSAAVLIMVLSVVKNVGINGERYVKPPSSGERGPHGDLGSNGERGVNRDRGGSGEAGTGDAARASAE
ncbi:MAG: lspA [Propionibacteriaceae bacterium]|jgi:signal peptidase II|nr:lspA [Propionibacteriaceae bacterium]